MISARIKYQCGGCDEEAQTDPIQLRAERVPAFRGGTMREAFASGASHVLCYTEFPSLDPREYAPERWVAFDPYTHVTYCPACWKLIEEDVNA